MATKWCYNSKTGEIFSYRQEGDWNDFPRGTWLADRDYLTTGLESEAAAQAWAAEWHACPTCKDTHRGAIGDPCIICRTPLIGPSR